MQERELIVRAKMGDKEALGEIVELYYKEIYLFLSRRLGDSFAAEDLTQDTFLKFTRYLPGYIDKGKLRAYLFTLAVNCSNDRFRKMRPLVPFEDGFLPEERAPEDVEEALEQSERAYRVKKAVLNLPRPQRDAVILRYYHGMRQKEIATILDIPVSTVKTRLHRANKVLCESLKGEKP